MTRQSLTPVRGDGVGGGSPWNVARNRSVGFEGIPPCPVCTFPGPCTPNSVTRHKALGLSSAPGLRVSLTGSCRPQSPGDFWRGRLVLQTPSLAPSLARSRCYSSFLCPVS